MDDVKQNKWTNLEIPSSILTTCSNIQKFANRRVSQILVASQNDYNIALKPLDLQTRQRAPHPTGVFLPRQVTKVSEEEQVPARVAVRLRRYQSTSYFRRSEGKWEVFFFWDVWNEMKDLFAIF